MRPHALNWDLLTNREVSADLDFGLASCLCVTRGRYVHLRRAVACFQAQTYMNRELVVVYESLEDNAHRLLEALGASATVVPVRSEPKLPLGELRNRAVSASSGAFVCCWDDDDWHAPRRLELQLRQIASTNADACLLTRWLVLDEIGGRAAMSASRPWEGSLVCRRDLPVLVAGYPPLARGEDTVLVRKLMATHAVSYLDQPELYIYAVHGENTWHARHFSEIFRAGEALSEADTARLHALIAEEL